MLYNPTDDLQEGNYLSFRVLNEIALPPDDERFYVMESESGKRHLMKADYYAHYQLKPGMSLRCRVDKVNCSGKVYLEPDHPGCQPGDVLDFAVLSSHTLRNSLGGEESLLVLNDPWGKPAHVKVWNPDSSKVHHSFRGRVERIKKGILLIADPEHNYFGKHELPDENRAFLLKEVITLAPGLEYYVLEQNESTHYLRTKYYSSYGFRLNQELHLRVLAKPGLYQHYLEPPHPYYRKGERYDFEFRGTEPWSVKQGDSSYRLHLADKLGHTYSIGMQGDEPVWNPRVTAKVHEIRMSKCILSDISFEQSDADNNGIFLHP